MSSRSPQFRIAVPVLVLAAVLVALAVPAAAQTAAPVPGDTFSRFELTPFFGYRLDGELEDADFGFAFGSFEPEVDESEVYGVSLGFGLNPNMLIEVLVSRQETELVFRPRRFGDEPFVTDLDLTTAHVGFVYQWRLGQADPYVVASGGVTQLDAGDDDTRLSASIGGGVKLRFSDHVGLRLEGRMFVTDVDSGFGEDDDDDDDRYERYDRDDILYQPELNIGLLFSF